MNTESRRPTPEPAEFVDQVGPDEARRLALEAVTTFGAGHESWRRRREATFRDVDTIFRRLKSDFEYYEIPLNEKSSD